MDSILKNLYFGRYAAFERKYEPNSNHAEAIDKVAELEEALMNDLPSELLTRFRVMPCMTIIAEVSGNYKTTMEVAKPLENAAFSTALLRKSRRSNGFEPS